MSSPSARAEARRKAILGRGGDRLAKLTTSARGEDAPAYLPTDAPARTAAFVGEETPMPPPPPPPPKDTPRPSLSPSPSPPQPDPSVWSEDQQRQFMQAILNNPSLAPSQPQPATEDPFANMMAQLTKMHPPQAQAQTQGGTAGKAPVASTAPEPQTQMQKWMPLLHLVCMWSLLAFFVLWKEPQVFVDKTTAAVDVAFWRRWPKLVTQGTLDGVWGVQVVPFFWAFMTLQVMLHSLHVFTGHSEVKPPAILSFVLPHLPPPFPSIITNGLRYLRLGDAFMNDIATIVFGIGVIILITSWLAD